MLVKVDDLKPGMQLMEDVILPTGSTLLSTSSILTERAIEMIKKYDFEHIQIGVDSTSPDEPTESDEIHAEAEELKQEENAAEQEEEDKTEEREEEKEEQKVYTLPKISVVIENDGFSALLRIESAGGEHERVTTQDIKNALVENDVVFGISDDLLEKTVLNWEKSPDLIECENIAQGTAPTSGKEGPLDITVKHIKNSRDLETAKEAEFHWALLNDTIPIQRVDEGTVIGIKELQIPEIPGMNVHGDEININQVIKTEVTMGDNVEEDEENNSFKSCITGVVYYIDNTVGVVPMNFDGSADLTISPDAMQADLSIHPPGEDGDPPTEESIRDLITEEKIAFGLRKKLLSKTLQKLSEGIFPQKPVTIAKGKEPLNGEDGKINYLFQTGTSLKPQEDGKGNVDFKHVSIVKSVPKGTKVARLVAPSTGKPGKDILGTEIPCAEGTPAVLPAGPNTVVSPDDANVLLAGINGNVRLNGQLVEVFEGFVIKGDVDFSTGNIEYDKSVIVEGDVKSGFSINCGGDLEVGGTIEDAVLQVGGNLLCKLGFSGQGKGLIVCKGDVNITFMNNQTIRCHGNVTIAKEALNSTIYARGTITALGTSLSIAGGTIVSRDGIVCHVVGNESGTQTILEAGRDFRLVEKLEGEEKKLVENQENIKKLLGAFKKLDMMVKAKKQLQKKELYLYNKLRKSIDDFGSEKKIIEEKIVTLTKKIADIGNPFIKIEHSAMPGTFFRIGSQHYMVQKEIIGPKTVRIINNDIRIL